MMPLGTGGSDSLPTSKQFHTTYWSVVLAAADSAAPGACGALEQLCRTYWYPLYAYVRRRGFDPHEAQDLTQEYFLYPAQHSLDTFADVFADTSRSSWFVVLRVSKSNQVATGSLWRRNLECALFRS